jgi:hypothetical protein
MYLSWRKNEKGPQVRYERAMVAGTALIVIALVIRLLFIPARLSEIGHRYFLPTAGLWLLNLAGWTLLLSPALVHGLFLIRTGRKRRAGYVLTVLTVFLFVLRIGIAGLASATLFSMVGEARNASLELRARLQERLAGAGLSSSARGDIERRLAREIYVHEGVAAEYIGPSGRSVPFQPLDEDLHARERHEHLTRRAKLIGGEMAYWAALFLATAVFGLLRSPDDLTSDAPTRG